MSRGEGATNADLARQVADFASRVTPRDQRWEYALAAGSEVTREGRRRYILKAMPSLKRFLGYHTASMLPARLAAFAEYGIEGAREQMATRSEFWRSHDPFAVCPIEPWQIGHVYFARLEAYPHIAKVGFSRRVRERLADIESKSGRLMVDALKVGTMADEHWWHRNWHSLNITGEWFFWPRSNDRSVPPFLRQREVA